MNGIRLSLLVLGIVLVSSVIVWNQFLRFQVWYSARKNKNEPKDNEYELQTQHMMHEFIFGELGQIPPSARQEDDTKVVDLDIQEVFDLYFEKPIKGQSLISALNQLLCYCSSGIDIFAITHDCFHRDHLEPEEYYKSLHVALIIATRHGFINHEEWSQVHTFLEEISHQCNCTQFEYKSYLDFSPKAQQLYKQIRSVDSILPCFLSFEQEKLVAEVVQTLLSQGFYIEKQFIVFRREGVRYQYRAFFSEPHEKIMDQKVKGFGIQFDVPNSTYVDHGFSDFYDLLYVLSRRLGAKIVNYENQLVSDHVLRSMDKQVFEVYKNMRNISIEPGSSKAALLFTDIG